MATTTNLATPIKGSMYRLTALNACGNPVTGTSGTVIVSKGFTQVQMEPQYEDGEEYFERTADGSVCVNQKDDSTLKRMELTITFCEIDVHGASYMLSLRELTTGSTTGYGWAMKEGLAANRWSLEVWQQVAGSGACDASGQQRYIYNAWPNCGNAKLGTYTVENGRSELEITAETKAASATAGYGWLAKNGSSSWLPAAATVAATEHWLWNITTTALPTVTGASPGTLP